MSSQSDNLKFILPEGTDKVNIEDFNTNFEKIDAKAGAGSESWALRKEIPSVPSWALEASKPSYTAAEVGALPSSTSIPAALSDLTSDDNHKTVTTTQINTWDGKIDSTAIADWAKASAKPEYTAAEVGALADTTVIPHADGDTITQAADGTLTVPDKHTKVTVTQLLDEGTQIAKIKVDDTETMLYAPAGGSGGGSTVSYTSEFTEGTKIGTLTIDSVGNDIIVPAGGGGEAYTLPAATSTTLGGIKVGENLTINEDGVLNAEKGGSTVTASAEYTDGTKIATITIDGTNTNIKVPSTIASDKLYYNGTIESKASGTDLVSPVNKQNAVLYAGTKKDYNYNKIEINSYIHLNSGLTNSYYSNNNAMYWSAKNEEGENLPDAIFGLSKDSSSSSYFPFIAYKGNIDVITMGYYCVYPSGNSIKVSVTFSFIVNGETWQGGFCYGTPQYSYEYHGTLKNITKFNSRSELIAKLQQDIPLDTPGSIKANIGDIIISDGNEWLHVPAGNSETSEVKLSTEGYTDNSIRFGITDDGQYGYYKVGADTVTPFKNGAPSGSVLSFGMTRCGSETKDVTLGQSYNSDYIQIIDDVKLKFLKSCSITIRILTSGNASYTSGYTIYLNNEIYKTVQHSVWTYDESYSLNVEEGDVINMTAYAHSSWQRDYSCCISLSN